MLDTPTELLADVERIKATASSTQAAYMELCGVLFFKYGKPPTAGMLHGLLRKGSMSAPANALRSFWTQMRERSRVELEHPGLPDTLKSVAAEALTKIYLAAVEHAQQGFDAERKEAAESVLRASKDLSDAHEHAADLQTQIEAQFKDLQQANHELEQMRKELNEALQHLAACRANVNLLQDQAQDLATKHEKELRGLRDLVDAANLERQQTIERCSAAERRALMEIDTERQRTVAMTRQLDQARKEAFDSASHNQRILSEMNAASTAHANVLLELGLARGKLESELEITKSRLAEANSQMMELRTALEEERNQNRSSILSGALKEILTIATSSSADSVKIADVCTKALALD